MWNLLKFVCEEVRIGTHRITEMDWKQWCDPSNSCNGQKIRDSLQARWPALSKELMSPRDTIIEVL